MKPSCHRLILFLSFILNHLGLSFPELDPIYLDYSSLLPATPLLLYYYSPLALLNTSYNLLSRAPRNTPSSIFQNMMLNSPLPNNGYPSFVERLYCGKGFTAPFLSMSIYGTQYEPVTTTTHPHNFFPFLSPKNTT